MITNSEMIKAVVTFGNYIYAIGGLNFEGVRNSTLKTVERYDVLNDKWEFVASMKYRKINPEAVVFNKKIYVFGKIFLILKFLIKIFMMFVIICIIVM